MAAFAMGLFFISGVPLMLLAAPAAWWPWSHIAWFVGFSFVLSAISAVGRRWKRHLRPAGAAGLAIGIAIKLSTSNGASGDGSGDGGDGGGGGD